METINSNSAPTTGYITDIPNTRYIKCRVETPQFYITGTKWFQQDGILDTTLQENGLCNNVKSMLFRSNHWYGHGIHFQNIESAKRCIVRIYDPL